MLRRTARFVALAMALACCYGCISISALPSGRIQEVVVRRSDRRFERNKIALIDVEGFIGVGSSWLLEGTTVADVREKLERAAMDSSVRAVVLRINSPGGGAGASDTIYHEIRGFRTQTGKPVVAAMVGTAASGGYYVALAADRIVASPSTVTGSVGVVMNLVNVEGLFRKLGLTNNVLKSGEMKDAGSPTRPMRAEERELLQVVIDEMFGRFLSKVRQRRLGMTEADLELISDGRVLTATQALDLHMVDRIGYLNDALAEAYVLAGIEHAKVVLYRPYHHYTGNIYSAGGAEPLSVEQRLAALMGRRGPAFLYLWAPGAP